MPNSPVVSYQILSDRSQYKPCKINVPDLDRPIAAIRVNQTYYSLFQVIQDSERAETIAERLTQRGDEVMITPTPKGSALWVKEAQGSPVSRSTKKAQNAQTPAKPPEPPYKILNSPEDYQLGYIQVPDLNDSLEAIECENQYYSLFKSFPDIHQASEIALRLAKKGDKILIIPNSPQFTLWILEPDAQWLASR
ncbi:MAG: hypothetical protein J7519_05815 [Roseofilum sp. SID1]|uniref:hypothetical protein n=1 Tax=Roseofilum sp. SID1 TaxID=2821497 RepID=UPI001B267B7E|nr:hypothetical protein [Roseofilum sp. SID1]MBP0037211.1 hypothetical protein [Roseofilum sp. SID1]